MPGRAGQGRAGLERATGALDSSHLLLNLVSSLTSGRETLDTAGGLQRKRLQKLLQIALWCPVPSQVFPVLTPFPETKFELPSNAYPPQTLVSCHSERSSPPLPYAPSSIDAFEGIQMLFSCPLGLNATFSFQRTQETQQRARPLAWPGLMGLPPASVFQCLPSLQGLGESWPWHPLPP